MSESGLLPYTNPYETCPGPVFRSFRPQAVALRASSWGLDTFMSPPDQLLLANRQDRATFPSAAVLSAPVTRAQESLPESTQQRPARTEFCTQTSEPVRVQIPLLPAEPPWRVGWFVSSPRASVQDGKAGWHPVSRVFYTSSRKEPCVLTTAVCCSERGYLVEFHTFVVPP